MDPRHCSPADLTSSRPTPAPFAVTRRSFLTSALATAIAVPTAVGGLIGTARAQDGDDDPVSEPAASSLPPSGPGAHTFSLAAGSGGPLGEGVTKNKWKAEIGYARYEGDSYVINLHPGDKELARQEWISRRIGQFSFRDGAVMVEARGELSPTGCFAIEMRHQAYKDRRYIRSNWLCLDPHDGHIHIQTDGVFNDMEMVADHHHDGYTPVRPPGEWNTFLFLASGDNLEGWVNGERAIAGGDGRWGSGQISLVAMRIDRLPFRARFRNLRVWDGQVPDPATLW